MHTITNKTTSVIGTIMHTIIVPLFAFLFTIYFKPRATYELLNMANTSFAFNVTILLCIFFVSISITRWCLYIIARYKQLTNAIYLFWCAGETLVASLFVCLYIVLISKIPLPYFEMAGISFLNMLAIAIYPYIILWMGFELYNKNNQDTLQSADNTLIRFYDEYKKLRIIIAPEAVIYIKSEDNYVQIHYLDQNRQKKFILRSSMRALEDSLSKHGLVRCHRSYFINPSYIKIVHRDKAGLIIAELKLDGYESIPISRKYHESITRLL